QKNRSASDTFAVARTKTVDFAPPLNPTDLQSDGFIEPFDFDSTSPKSFEDETALFGDPRADWGDGALSSAFAFEGTGGPGGNFHWLVLGGDFQVIDTTNGAILGEDGTIQR